MKKIITLLILGCCSLGFSQIKYEKGYYIDNNNNRVDGLIRNIDWKNNPNKFSYKSDENAEAKTIALSEAKEFSILNTSKFIREKVNLDISSELLHNMSMDSLPEYKEDTVYLKVLVEGKANLYVFADDISKKFFYQKDQSDVTPLVYKRYIKVNGKREKDNGNMGKNETYKRQLWTDMGCNLEMKKKINTIDYNEKALVKYVKGYNVCEGDVIEEISDKKKEPSVVLAIRPQMALSSFKFDNSQITNSEYNLGSNIGFGIGLEAEYTLPFNNKKWGLIIEPSFKFYSFDKDFSGRAIGGGNRNITLNYTAFEIPVGVRYHFFINDKSRIYINAGYQFNVDMKANLEVDEGKADLDLKSSNNAVFGIGYKYNRFSFEYRINTNRSLTPNYTYWNSTFNSMSFILGYSFTKF
jgi:hypothetical protein